MDPWMFAIIVALAAGPWQPVLDPRDSGCGEGLNPLLWQDPRGFAPQANPELQLRILEQWGTTGPSHDDPKQRTPRTWSIA